ncbi:tetratricopeptide repeat protein [Crossiella sp. CA-258035]|uniref:tetratricopeptide repeat protein n=1 Tax=Crossiella sp. CA-258035 TaxID=2981138 RepID=UPI0024BCA5D8|nr:tetratricopeptide repeat protein [Crossiella sp. CA-258035]WHT16997.1 tetratricopeptide repeat protein [Crossiella sp. CA-258035]
MDFRILGPVSVWVDGCQIGIGHPELRRLLAILLLADGRPVPKEQVIADLWDGAPPLRPARALRSQFAQLSQTLPLTEAQLHSAHGKHQLQVDLERLDWHRFRQLVGRGRTAARSGRYQAAADILAQALSEWQGDALADVDGDWARRCRAHLERQRRSARQCLVAARRACTGRQIFVPMPRRSEVERGPVPAQLPLGIADFIGREQELTTLGTALPGTVTVINGPPGSGKTALALAWAHRISDRHPDGALFAELRGHGPGEPVPPTELLADFLTSLGVAPAKIPAAESCRAELFRTLLIRRRLLLVLDGARDLAQVEPLLPGLPGVTVVITSHEPLDLPGRRVTLGPLSPADATALLKELIGPGRVANQAGALADLARYCGYLPLPLRIAGRRVAARPHTYLADLVGELREERQRLERMAPDTDGSAAMRGTFRWSYRALPLPAQRMFRLLGLYQGVDIDAPAAAALSGMDTEQAAELLQGLAKANLLQPSPRGAFQLHDLLRGYAGERALREEGANNRQAAVRRLLDFYRAAGADPGHGWCDTELLNLVAAANSATSTGHHEVAVDLLTTAGAIHRSRGQLDRAIARYYQAWVSGDRTGDTDIAHRLGEAYLAAGRLCAAVEVLGRAAPDALTLDLLGGCFQRLGRPDAAIQHFQRGLRLVNEPSGEARLLSSLGEALRRLGSLAQAREHLTRALELSRRIGDHGVTAHCLHSLSQLPSTLTTQP